MSSQATATRGSQKLIEQLAQKGAHATVEEVKAAVAAPAEIDYKILRWLTRGTPVNWIFDATVEVSTAQLSRLVNAVVENHGLVDINILVNGIPKPDIATVRFTSPGGEIRG